MEIKKAASVPLITHDPYFSIWSSTDCLNESDPVHWSRARQQLKGYLEIDGVPYRFLGEKGRFKGMKQKSLSVTATDTEYVFEQEKVELSVKFTSPLLLDDPVLVSRPCTYVEMKVKQKTPADVKAIFQISADLVRQTPGKVIGGEYGTDTFHYACMGKAGQHPLGLSGDNTTIDWGYVYLAAQQKTAEIAFDVNEEKLQGVASLSEKEDTVTWVVAYDDQLSICYFGEWKKAYWTTRYATILDAIGASFREKDQVMERCRAWNKTLEEKAVEVGGKPYAFLCNMSYRHAIAAHKLIADEKGRLIFLSKENDSNGCIGTVDVTYPSVPLFFLFGTEYIKGMLRPVFRFAKCPVWEYDFAPHDVGRYPYATGQVYGLHRESGKKEHDGANGNIFPFFCQYPDKSNVYDFKGQMPVEECGNMIILTAAVCIKEKSSAFADEYMDLLEMWVQYLLKYGADPGEQLCTDDFAGHLAHNTNLAVKAILGIEAFAQIAGIAGKKDRYQEYHEKAASMAADWERNAGASDHYRLTFDREDSWSLKYNLVWDKLFGSKLFRAEVYDKEMKYYLRKSNAYGVPLDSRADYTKSDWILWCASLAEDGEQRRKFIAPVADYLEDTRSRVPFSDWYNTVSGDYCHFIARSVQGGIFMPLLMDKKL